MPNENKTISTVPAEDDGASMPDKTDMVKVNFLLSRPLLLLDMLPEGKRSEMSAHVGRRSMNRASTLANPRLRQR